MLKLKVKLLHAPYAAEEWEAIFEVDAGTVLDHLHTIIQRTLSFDDDHLYEFFVANSERSRNRVVFDNENRGLYETNIGELYPLAKHKQLFYLFDYGDNWLFKITKLARAATKSRQADQRSSLIQESGTRPLQYSPEDEDDA